MPFGGRTEARVGVGFFESQLRQCYRGGEGGHSRVARQCQRRGVFMRRPPATLTAPEVGRRRPLSRNCPPADEARLRRFFGDSRRFFAPGTRLPARNVRVWWVGESDRAKS